MKTVLLKLITYIVLALAFVVATIVFLLGAPVLAYLAISYMYGFGVFDFYHKKYTNGVPN